MSLENLTGPNTGFNDLVPTNPDGTDPVSEGDNHIRGVKNVTVNVLGPMVSAAVSLPAVDQALMWDGTKYIPKTVVASAPTRQVFTAGSGTYTRPAGCRAINVRMVGGGGGGAGGGGATGDGTAGSASLFGGVLSAGSGAAGSLGFAFQSLGGVATGGDINIRGGDGAGANGAIGVMSGAAGNSAFGGAGATTAAFGGSNAAVNSGSGGAGGASSAANTGGGGAAGGYVEKLFSPAAASYSFTVGAAGSGGTGTVTTGGNGAAGIIIVDEYY